MGNKPTVVSGCRSCSRGSAPWPAHLAIAVADAAASFARGADRRRCPPSARRHFWTATRRRAGAHRLSVPLASNGARPSMAACVAAFDTPGDMVVAARGPEVLLASLDAELRPRRVRLTRDAPDVM